jgi:hypothetical protein
LEPWSTPFLRPSAKKWSTGAGFHIRADERLNAVETGLWATIATAVAIGRWDLVSSVAGVSSWVLVALLGLLVPVAIINVIVLWRRPVKAAR